MTDTIFLMTEATQTALIVGGFGFAGIVVTSIVQIVLAVRRNDRVITEVTALSSNLIDEDGKPKLDKVQANVGALATEIDGRMAELKQTIAAKSLAEGQLKGIAGEQERVADLITEPAKVTEAMNGKDVREQIDKIELAVAETQETLAETPAVRPAVRKQLDKIEQAVTDGDKK